MRSFYRMFFGFAVLLAFNLVCFNCSAHSIRQVEATPFAQDKDYGQVTAQPFADSWLHDYPYVLEHVKSEQLLHVKGKDEFGVGLTWHTEKFETDMDERYSPEAVLEGAKRGGFQMKLGYFLVPQDMMSILKAPNLSPDVLKVIEYEKDQQKFYRFFVHPLAYDHFRVLHKNSNLLYVPPENSNLIGTPSSSYRSWVVRSVQQAEDGSWIPEANSLPFILKLGVPGSVLGSDRWLTPNEIERSIYAQMALDDLPPDVFFKSEAQSDNFYVFPENMGLILRNIPGYPSKSENESTVKESGLILREFPKGMLEGKNRIFCFAALMSPERVKAGNREIGSFSKGTGELPLIYEVITATIQAGLVKTTREFMEKYFIDAYLSSIESLVFKEGFRPEPHSQNLLFVLNRDLTPKGFAYRDFGGFWVDIATRGLQDKDVSVFQKTSGESHRVFKSKFAIEQAYIKFYSWFYRYQIMIKMLNALLKLPGLQEAIPAPPGAPYQIGKNDPLEERVLYPFIVRHINAESKANLDKLALDIGDYKALLSKLDESFLRLLSKYFDLEKVDIQMVDGFLPSAESGSEGEHLLFRHKGFLGKYRFQKLSSLSKKFPIEKLPKPLLERAETQAITSFAELTFKNLGAVSFAIENRGLCFFNEKYELVAFLPYMNFEEKDQIENQIINCMPLKDL